MQKTRSVAYACRRHCSQRSLYVTLAFHSKPESFWFQWAEKCNCIYHRYVMLHFSVVSDLSQIAQNCPANVIYNLLAFRLFFPTVSNFVETVNLIQWNYSSEGESYSVKASFSVRTSSLNQTQWRRTFYFSIKLYQNQSYWCTPCN